MVSANVRVNQDGTFSLKRHDSNDTKKRQAPSEGALIKYGLT